MENVLMENATADQDLQEMIVQFVHAHQIAMTMENVSTTHASVKVDGLDLIVHSDHAHQNVQEMDIATTQHAFANLDLLEFIVHFQHAHHHAQEMEDVSQLVLKWDANVMKDTKDMTAPRKLAKMIALEMENALVEFALARMVGVDLIVLLAALDMVKDAVEMENVLKDNATAIQDGQDMVVIFEHASMTAHNTVIAAMELASAKKDTVVEIAHFHLNHNHASAQFTVFVDAFNNAQKFMRLKVLDHHMNATQNAPKNAFHSVLLEKCLII
jgi:galactitol-specific phosphotransferase system IIB component